MRKRKMIQVERDKERRKIDRQWRKKKEKEWE